MNVTLTIGSNMPDRCSRVEAAIQWLRTVMTDLRATEPYTTRPISGIGPDYVNALATGCVSNTMSADEFEAMLKRYETDSGRDESCRAQGRVPIDIDLVWVDGQCRRPAEISRTYYVKGAEMLGLT